MRPAKEEERKAWTQKKNSRAHLTEESQARKQETEIYEQVRQQLVSHDDHWISEALLESMKMNKAARPSVLCIALSPTILVRIYLVIYLFMLLYCSICCSE